MSPPEEEIEKILKQCCQQVVTWGWSIQPNVFLDVDGWACCPLGALLIVTTGSSERIQRDYHAIKHHLDDRISTLLGVDSAWRYDFWQGFDDSPGRGIKHQQAFLIGKNLRKEFIEKRIGKTA